MCRIRTDGLKSQGASQDGARSMHQEEDVRRIPRKSLAVSLAAALSLGVSATAFGDGAGDNTSQVSAGVNPTLVPESGAPQKASLYTQVTTLDNDNTPATPAEAAEVVEIDFPADMKYTANNKLDKCALADVTPLSTDAAAVECASSLVGSGHAFARIPGTPTPNNELELTVLAFNGQTSVNGGGFTGGNPTIILHADSPTLPTTPVLGEIRDSDGGPNYGKELNVPDAPDVAGDVGALVQFGAQVSKGYTNGKSGKKKKKYNLISANCGGDEDFDFQSTWTYDDDSVDTDTYSQDCTPKP
jgi:hypothetical protein